MSDAKLRKVAAGELAGLRDATLDGIAAAFDLDVNEVYRLAGRKYSAPPPTDTDLAVELEEISRRLAAASARLREA